jgi:centrosomal protein CEP110
LQLNIEKRKEIQEEKQKALDLEGRKQVNRKKALLTRVQEILENVQVCNPDFQIVITKS